MTDKTHHSPYYSKQNGFDRQNASFSILFETMALTDETHHSPYYSKQNGFDRRNTSFSILFETEWL